MAADPLAQPEEAIRRLYGYVAYRIGPGPDAEDVVSATIERALSYRSSYDPRHGTPGRLARGHREPLHRRPAWAAGRARTSTGSTPRRATPTS